MKNRDQVSGKYLYDFSRMCVCGHTAGCHTAIRSKRSDGSSYQPCVAGASDCECDVFRLAKKT